MTSWLPKREPDLQDEAFASEIVDDRDRPNIAAVCQSVMGESIDQRSLARETAGTTLPRDIAHLALLCADILAALGTYN